MKSKTSQLGTSGKQEMVHFREYCGIMQAVRKYAGLNDLTISQIMRKALRQFLLDAHKATISQDGR